MKKLLCLCAALMMAFTAASAFAASDVTGTWTGNMVGPNGDSMPITFTFKLDGDQLPGTVASPMGDPMEITEGKVDGDNISFNVSFNGMTIKHEGVIAADTIKLTSKSDNGAFPDMEMTLTRAKTTP